MDLGDWLRSLGLEQYEAAFRDNAITGKVLPNLTADDLKDLGVGMVGHRGTLLDAIAYLRVHANAKASPSDAPSPLSKPAQETAERRQVTVMFSDLVGSTALSARMVISAYQKCVAETPVVRAFHTPCARRSAFGRRRSRLCREKLLSGLHGCPSPERKTGGTARRDEHGPLCAIRASGVKRAIFSLGSVPGSTGL